MTSPITTHVLDTAQGKPAKEITAVLAFQGQNNAWQELGSGKTNQDGRITDLLSDVHSLQKGLYKITFETADYFRDCGKKGFYPSVQILFEIEDPNQHYHIPLLLSPFGYTTYRGS